MSLFPETIATALGGGKVELAPLVLFDFATQPMRLWRGHGKLSTKDGNTWSGLGELGSIGGIAQAINGEAPEMSFTLNGVDAKTLLLARDEFATEARDRMVKVYLQFFGEPDKNDPDNQRPLDNPFAVAAGRMLKPVFTFARDGEDGEERSIGVTAESIFSLRSRPRFSMYTDSDQQHRFPGDKGFQFVAQLLGKEVTWPDY